MKVTTAISLFKDAKSREKMTENLSELENLKSAEDWYKLYGQPELLKKYGLTITSIDEHPTTFTQEIFKREIGVITFSNGVKVGYEFIDPFNDSPVSSHFWFVQAPK